MTLKAYVAARSSCVLRVHMRLSPFGIGVCTAAFFPCGLLYTPLRGLGASEWPMEGCPSYVCPCLFCLLILRVVRVVVLAGIAVGVPEMRVRVFDVRGLATIQLEVHAAGSPKYY